MRIILSAFLAFTACSAFARDEYEAGKWLCSKIFEGGDITLAFAEDGFFGMKIAPKGKPVQNITGQWRLSPDGVDLTLYTLQDSRIRMSVGKGALYVSSGAGGHVTLLPVQKDRAKFRITGMLRKIGVKPILTDAGSGRDFEVNDDAQAADGKFAIAEIEIGRGYVSPGHIIKHSGAVPRLWEREAQGANIGDFAADVACRYWVLPQSLWRERAALRFSAPEQKNMDSDKSGTYEVSGPGLRVEGKYQLAGETLKLNPDSTSLRNLEILGAKQLGDAVSGERAWKLTSRGLELSSAKGRLLLLAP